MDIKGNFSVIDLIINIVNQIINIYVYI